MPHIVTTCTVDNTMNTGVGLDEKTTLVRARETTESNMNGSNDNAPSDTASRAAELLFEQKELRPIARKVAQSLNKEGHTPPEGHGYFTADLVLGLLSGTPKPPISGPTLEETDEEKLKAG